VKDRGPVVTGIIQQARSTDGHALAMIVPYKGFLIDENGVPIVDLGRVLDLSFSLEASPELAPGQRWASDTADPINGYQLAAGGTMANLIRIPAGQLSAAITLVGIDDSTSNPGRTAIVGISEVAGAGELGEQQVVFDVVDDDPLTDLRLLDFTADGQTTLSLKYEIAASGAVPFEIGFYRSGDLLFDAGDVGLGSVLIEDANDLTVGSHTKSFAIGAGAGQVALPGAGGAEVPEDYFMLAAADPADLVAETDAQPFQEDNTAAFSGIYHAPGGAVFLHGTAADDSIAVTAGASLNFNGTITSYSTVNVNGVRIRAHAGNDVIDGSTADEALFVLAGAGNDIMTSGPINDTFVGGMGNDTYRFDADNSLGNDTVDERDGGIDTLDFSATTTKTIFIDLTTAGAVVVNSNLAIVSNLTFVEHVQGGALDDTLRGNALNNILIGGPAGNDTLIGGFGDDTLLGGSGHDVLEGGPGNDTLNGGADNDIYWFDADAPLGSDTLVEVGVGIDTLNFSATTTRAVAVNLSLPGPQVVNANLTLTLGSGSLFENAAGGALGDLLTGNALSNTLTGNAGNDILEGAGGNDLLRGGADDDTYRFDVDAPLGIDFLDESPAAGGGGSDTLDFSATTTVNLAVNLGLAGLQTVASGRLSLKLQSDTAFENVIGGAQIDWLTGNSRDNRLTGGPGNDVYWFDADSPQGHDTLEEVPGGGVDTLNFSQTTTQSVFLRLAQTDPQVVNANLTLSLSSGAAFENVTGGGLSDIIVGNGLANLLQAGGGRDLLIGGAGSDRLFGHDADDILIAGTTAHDTDDVALLAILAEWNSGDDYATRTTRLRTGAAGVTLAAGTTVFNDSSLDTLTGNAGEDWIFKAIDDVFADPQIGELVETT
jgi:Ca2+-binding RTX toxin-like protein